VVSVVAIQVTLASQSRVSTICGLRQSDHIPEIAW